MPDENLQGLLFIGDPHLCGIAPGFRKDDYANVILSKLRWALDYARENHLQPVLLGDLFHFPRDNPNWTIVQLLAMLDRTLAIAGNHDQKENSLSENDSLSILVESGAIRLLDDAGPWQAIINGRAVIVGGASWGKRLPAFFDKPDENALVFWALHHDIRFPGYEEQGRMDCREIPGIDCIINGHLHRDLGRVQSGGTLWINPGNITRIARSDAAKAHIPGVLRIDIKSNQFDAVRIAVPHADAAEIFHPEVETMSTQDSQSMFINGMLALESARTATGAGLQEFLGANLGQFDPKVADVIRSLATEVFNNGNS